MTEKPSNEAEDFVARMNNFGALLFQTRHTMRGAFGFSPAPMRENVRGTIQALRQRRPMGDVVVVDETDVNHRTRGFGFGILEGLRRNASPQNPEADVATDEMRKQAVEAAEKRKVDEKATEERKQRAADLERVRREFGDVQVSG